MKPLPENTPPAITNLIHELLKLDPLQRLGSEYYHILKDNKPLSGI